MRVYGTNIIIEPIIERDDVDSFYDRNDFKLVSSAIGLIVQVGDGVSIDVKAGDKVFFRNELSRALCEREVIVDEKAVLLKYEEETTDD